MNRQIYLAVGLLAGVLTVVVPGCTDSASSTDPDTSAAGSTNNAPPAGDEPTPNGDSTPGVTPGPARNGPGSKATPQPTPEPPPLTMPEIKLSDAHAATCLVKQGELLPEVTLPGLESEPQKLADLLGERLTLVFFWAGENLYSLVVLEDMGPDVLSPFGQRGVRVVGINEKDSPEVARQHVEQAGAKFPVLLDRDGAYFGRISAGGVPRLYLVDETGKILWFDIEYGKETRRHIQNAIRYCLGER